MAADVATPLIAQQVAHDQQKVRAGLLHSDCAAAFYPAKQDVPWRGVVLLLHGFTAGPWQFRDLCHALSARGLHCYTARLPGHGATERTAFSSRELPKSNEVKRYSQCADLALEAAQQLASARQLPLMVVGFSAGGALAADLLLRAPQAFARAVLIAPLLRPLGLSRRMFFRAMRHIPLAGRLIDRLPFAWKAPAPRPDGWLRPGHSQFHFGNVSALLAYAHTVEAQKRSWRVPTQFILTANDDKIDPYTCRAFAQKLPVPHPVYWFGPECEVPHAMISPQENGDANSRARVHTIVTEFLLDGVGHSNC